MNPNPTLQSFLDKPAEMVSIGDDEPVRPISAKSFSSRTESIVSTKSSKSKKSKVKDDKKKTKKLAITDVEAMEAASIEIKEIIERKGSISAAATSKIIQEKMNVLQNLWTHFPNALSSQKVLDTYKKVAESRGYTPENTLFAQSICPDEVNHEEGDITDLFTKYCGEVFHMGGLGGIPFTGKVGFGAFSHHCPDEDGHLAVLMAPHIGIDKDGKLGKYDREGQENSGACCGAAVGAYGHCCAGKPPPNLAVHPEEYQFNYIINQVHDNMCRIVGETESEKQASLARVMHQVGSDLLDKNISFDFGDDKSTVVVLSGVQVNMPDPFCDYFLPMQFYILKKDGSKEDIFEESFGFKASDCIPSPKSNQSNNVIPVVG
ncbi:MAG: hypothetical protein SGARI_002903 [Bacillariaceae sp.]